MNLCVVVSVFVTVFPQCLHVCCSACFVFVRLSLWVCFCGCVSVCSGVCLYGVVYLYCMCLYVRLHVCDFLSAYSISVSLGLYINLERWAKRQGQAVVETETGTQVLVGCDYCTPGLNPVCTVVEGAGDKRVLRETEVECVRLH